MPRPARRTRNSASWRWIVLTSGARSSWTIAVAPTLNNVLQLGLIVVIRTFLSFSLETEIEGIAPWWRP